MSLSKAQSDYLKEIERCLNFLQSQNKTLEKVCALIFESLKKGEVIHVFGSGHSHIFAEEMFHRAGGLVPVNAMLEEYLMPHMGPRRVGPLERSKGIAPIIFDNYDLRAGEVLILVSNSGINAVTVELAELAKSKGIQTVAITSLTHSKATQSRAGKKLYEIVEHIIDTGTPFGDAAVSIKGSDLKVAPLSGVISLVIGELIVARVTELYAEKGLVPPVLQSANTPGGDQRNKALEDQYRSRVKRL